MLSVRVNAQGRIKFVIAEGESLQGEIPPPFESHAENRWAKENKASSYGLEERLPVANLFRPGVTENSRN